MSQPIAFTPMGSTQTVNVTASNQTVTLPFTTNQVRVYNAGTLPAFINPFGAIATTAAGVPIAPSSVEVFTIGPGGLIGVIASGASGNCYFTGGEGL